MLGGFSRRGIMVTLVGVLDIYDEPTEFDRVKGKEKLRGYDVVRHVGQLEARECLMEKDRDV